MNVCGLKASQESHEMPIPMATRLQEFKVQILAGDSVCVCLSAFFICVCAKQSAIDNLLCKLWHTVLRSQDKDCVKFSRVFCEELKVGVF